MRAVAELGGAEAKQMKAHWSYEEHARFCDGLRAHGRDWQRLTAYHNAAYPERTVAHVRSHYQKYEQRVAKEAAGGERLDVWGSDCRYVPLSAADEKEVKAAGAGLLDAVLAEHAAACRDADCPEPECCRKRAPPPAAAKRRRSPEPRPSTPLESAMHSAIEQLRRLPAEDGRCISALFESLPDRELFPDYYQLIAEPLSLRRVQARVRSGRYASYQPFERDMLLIFRNAFEYNLPGSQIYADAETLEQEFRCVAARHRAVSARSSSSLLVAAARQQLAAQRQSQIEREILVPLIRETHDPLADEAELVEEINYRFEQAGLPKDCSLSRIVSARTCLEHELKATRQRVTHSLWRNPHEQLELSQKPHNKPAQDTEPEEEETAVSIDELTFTDELPPPGALAAKVDPDDGDGYGDGGALDGAGFGRGLELEAPVPEDLWAQIRAANLAQEEAEEPAVLEQDTQPPKQKRAPPKKREKKGSAKQRRRGGSGSRTVCLVRGGRNGVGAHASGGQKRRRRSDDGSVAELYSSLHARIPQPSAGTASASGSVADLMSAEFSDKELRLLMKFNGLSINRKRKGTYIEIQKPAKCAALVRLSSF